MSQSWIHGSSLGVAESVGKEPRAAKEEAEIEAEKGGRTTRATLSRRPPYYPPRPRPTLPPCPSESHTKERGSLRRKSSRRKEKRRLLELEQRNRGRKERETLGGSRKEEEEEKELRPR